MRNDKAKPMRVVLLNGDGDPIPEVHEVIQQGIAGVRISGRVTVLYWADENKTWKRVEDEK